MDPPKKHCLPAKIGHLIGTEKKFRPLVVLTRLSIAHYFIIMCHLWVRPANNHQWKEETKSKSAHSSLHSSKNIIFEKQIAFLIFTSNSFKHQNFKLSSVNDKVESFSFIRKIFSNKFKQNFQRTVFQG